MAPLLGVVLAEGIRAHPEGMIPAAGALLTYCHLLPAVLWAGMPVYTARAAITWRAHPESARGLFRLYGTAAAWLFGVVVVTGVISALLLVPLGSLLTTTYGRFLVAKAALVAVAAALALASRAGLRRPAEPGARLPLPIRLEIAALAAVLAVTGLLTVLTTPPAQPVFSSGAQSVFSSGAQSVFSSGGPFAPAADRGTRAPDPPPRAGYGRATLAAEPGRHAGSGASGRDGYSLAWSSWPPVRPRVPLARAAGAPMTSVRSRIGLPSVNPVHRRDARLSPVRDPNRTQRAGAAHPPAATRATAGNGPPEGAKGRRPSAKAAPRDPS